MLPFFSVLLALIVLHLHVSTDCSKWKKDVNMTLSVRLNTLLINSFDMNISAVIAPQIYKFFQENL